jgi:hypothetical protein
MSKSTTFLNEIKKNPQDYYIIHYSCQSLNDDNEGLSPRITSIAIQHFKSGQAISFSTHTIAEELGIDKNNVWAEFNQIEKKLIPDFYKFVEERKDKFWIHWNMRNSSFGFEHIEHRCKVLGTQNPPVIRVENRINLNDMISNRYGYKYVEDPKLQNLMNMNGGVHRNFLNGKEEVEAFRKSEFIRMHNSTLSKVSFFCRVIHSMIRGQLKTKSSGWGIRLDNLFESRLAKAIGLISAIAAVIQLVIQLFNALN